MIIFKIFCEDKNIDELLQKFLEKICLNKNINVLRHEIKKYFKMFVRFIPEQPKHNTSTSIICVKEFFGIYKILFQVFSETYADIQMITLMDLSMQEYLNAFLIRGGLSINDLLKHKLFYRIFSVVYTMVKIGVWKFDETVQQENEVVFYLKNMFKWQLSNFIKNESELCKYAYNMDSKTDFKGCDKEPYIIECLYEYLSVVVQETKKHYGTKKEKDEFVNMIRVITEFNDAAEVFDNIQKMNNSYLESTVLNIDEVY